MPTWSLIYFQDRASPSIEQLIFIHDFTISIIVLITILVAVSIISIITLKQTNRFLLQNQTIEIIWTSVPVIILLIIAAPSLQALYLLEDQYNPNLTIKAIGHQWYWSYEYSDFTNLEFNSYIMPQNNSAPRLLDTDNSVIIPTNTQIRIITTGSDVIHSWTIPALGVKADAIPGRLNQITFSIRRVGLFFGQCSEICGANHRFIPIKLESVPLPVFTNWANSLSIRS